MLDDKPIKKPVKTERSKMINLTMEQKNMITTAAIKTNRSVSSFILNSSLKEAREVLNEENTQTEAFAE